MGRKSRSKDWEWAIKEADLLNRMTNRIRQSLELQEILSATVAEVRSFLATDRIKVYRFKPDGAGEVIAESIYEKGLPSLLGLHFPASDIPPHAREMYLKSKTRSIVDVAKQQIILNRPGSWETTGDLTVEDVQNTPIEDILQRPVDPCHVEYLRAMGVESSLVVPVLHQQELWGLLISHHSQAKSFTARELRMMQMIADQLSVAIAQSNLLSAARARGRREALINQIATLLHAPLNIYETLQGVLQKIVTAVAAAGGRLYLTALDRSSMPELHTIGIQPDLLGATSQALWLEYHPFWQYLMGQESQSDFQLSEIDDIRRWTDLLFDRGKGEFNLKENTSLRTMDDIYQEPQLLPLAEAFREPGIRGMLVMPLRYGKHCLGCLTLFRKEIDTDILWAGRFDPDERNVRVRQSFEAWREIKLGQTQPWSAEEIELVQAVGTHVAMAVMQNRLFLWEREHRLLVEMRNQELQAARSAAEQASRLKSDFLSSTSHELRTPLASTLNYLKLLKEGFYDNEEELKEYIEVAHQSAENLVGIINDVLDIAKIEAGRMSVNCEALSLSSMLEELRRLFNVESRRKAIPLIIDSEVETVWADKIKLRQILTNLLSNAFKFTTTGEVRLRVIHKTQGMFHSHPELSAFSEVTRVIEISVADTGIGIEASQKNMVFEPFVQADGSIKRRYGGTGLGLTVCKRLVELMGGQIWLESAGKGLGTTVTFTLPCN